MKKILSLLLAVVMLFGCCASLASCGEEDVDLNMAPVAKADIKFGLICLHDENSTYDKNFLDAAERMRVALGLEKSQLIIKTGIPEDDGCYDAAVELVEAGCQVIFANSFGHEDYIMKAAAEFPTVQFCHATGTKAHTSFLGNYHNAFASIYEGRYAAGAVAGMKILDMLSKNELDANEYTEEDGVKYVKIGYVGAFPYAEVISGYTAWFLGVRTVVEGMSGGTASVKMEVKYTNSWYDEAKEKTAAEALIANGCALISQHADSMGAPTACENAGVPNVSYNGSTKDACPNTYLVSSYIDWDPYFQLIVNSVIDGVRIPEEYCGGFAEGSVKLTDLNDKAGVLPENTAEMIEGLKESFAEGYGYMVFATSTFTKGGQAVTTYKANVNEDAAYAGDTEVILPLPSAAGEEGKYFAESKYRSAPYFDIIIDGITVPAAN